MALGLQARKAFLGKIDHRKKTKVELNLSWEMMFPLKKNKGR